MATRGYLCRIDWQSRKEWEQIRFPGPGSHDLSHRSVAPPSRASELIGTLGTERALGRRISKEFARLGGGRDRASDSGVLYAVDEQGGRWTVH
jgi:hypothetical protein